LKSQSQIIQTTQFRPLTRLGSFPSSKLPTAPKLREAQIVTMTSPTQSAIIWPDKYLPGTTDNYVSNEVIAANLTASDIWPLLADITKWESYYSNCSQITPPSTSPILQKGDTFSFSTFGLPPLPSEVWESVEPTTGNPGRLAWRATQDGKEEEKLDVYHAWIVEDLAEVGGVKRVRILTQESQIGQPAAQLAVMKPNPMLNGHQDWLDGLVSAARRK
jgi:hypothetical protein